LGEIFGGDMDWIDPAQDRNQWRSLVNTVMNRLVPWNAGVLSTTAQLQGVSNFGRQAKTHPILLLWFPNVYEPSFNIPVSMFQA
jgi:hypothetical protein